MDVWYRFGVGNPQPQLDSKTRAEVKGLVWRDLMGCAYGVAGKATEFVMP